MASNAGILGQVAAEPLFGTWERTKAFWFQAMDYKIHSEEVRAFHASEARTLIVEAPARGSKSFSTAHDLVCYGLPSTRPVLDSRHAIVGTDYATNKEFDYVYDILVTRRRQLMFQGEAYKVERANNNPRSGDLEIVLSFGTPKSGFVAPKRAVFRGLSSQNEVSLQGEQWTTVTLSEAAEHAPHILTKHFATRAWRTYLPTTPKSKAQWLKELGEEGRADPGLGVAVFRFPPGSNPLYDWTNFRREEKLARVRARRLYGPRAQAAEDPFFAEQFLGEWVYYTGRVFPFDRGRHVVDPKVVAPLLARAQFWLSTDYGYEDPWSTGLWAVLSNGLYIRLDEIYERRLSTPAFIERLDVMLGRHELHRSQVRATGDPSRPEVARLLSDEGFSVIETDKNAQRDRAAGKRRIADLLTQGPIESPRGGHYPGLFFSSRCQAAIAEFESLHYKEKVSNEDAITAFSGPDHAVDDTRYFVMSRPLPRSEASDANWLEEYKRQMRAGQGATFHDLAGTRYYA